MIEKTAVIILAGGGDPSGLAAGQGVAHPCLVKICNEAIIERMIAAFASTSEVTEIIVVSNPEVLACLPEAVTRVTASGSAADNIALGVQASKADWLVISPADVPWLTPEVITDFIQQSLATGAKLVYPIVSQADYNKKYPGGRRTYVTLREGTYTGANLILAKRDFVETLLPFFRNLFKHRKNPLMLAHTLGFGFVIKMLLKRLDIAGIERHAVKLLGGKALALPINRPEMAFDIDCPEDLETASKFANNQ